MAIAPRGNTSPERTGRDEADRMLATRINVSGGWKLCVGGTKSALNGDHDHDLSS